MQENQVPQVPTPKTSFQSLFVGQNGQQLSRAKYQDFCFSQFSAFKLVKSSSDKQNSACSSESDSSEDTNKRTKRGCYRKYTLQEKQEAVRKILSGYDVKEISRQYSIPRRNLLRWKKNGCQRKQGGGRPTDSQLQTILYSKIINKDLKSQKQIREQAKKLSKCDNFKASKGWFSKFSKRFNHWNQKISDGLQRQSLQLSNIENGQYQNK